MIGSTLAGSGLARGATLGLNNFLFGVFLAEAWPDFLGRRGESDSLSDSELELSVSDQLVAGLETFLLGFEYFFLTGIKSSSSSLDSFLSSSPRMSASCRFVSWLEAP